MKLLVRAMPRTIAVLQGKCNVVLREPIDSVPTLHGIKLE